MWVPPEINCCLSIKVNLHYDTLLEPPNRIGISLIGYLSSKLAHLLLNLITITHLLQWAAFVFRAIKSWSGLAGD